MDTIYKITRPDQTTYNGFQYEVGKEYQFPGGKPLCSDGWSHAYLTPELAVLLNPIHANYNPFTLWEASGVIGMRDHQLKVGCSSIILQQKIAVPLATPAHRVAFAIACAWPHASASWRKWAKDWLSGTDRSAEASWAAAEAAEAASWAASWAAAWAAAKATSWAAAKAASWAAAEAAASTNLIVIAHWSLSLTNTISIELPPEIGG